MQNAGRRAVCTTPPHSRLLRHMQNYLILADGPTGTPISHLRSRHMQTDDGTRHTVAHTHFCVRVGGGALLGWPRHGRWESQLCRRAEGGSFEGSVLACARGPRTALPPRLGGERVPRQSAFDAARAGGRTAHAGGRRRGFHALALLSPLPFIGTTKISRNVVLSRAAP